jgi:hypothetical protein
VAARCATFLASFPRACPSAVLGGEALESLSHQAAALSNEFKDKAAAATAGEGSAVGGAASRLNQAMGRVGSTFHVKLFCKSKPVKL